MMRRFFIYTLCLSLLLPSFSTWGEETGLPVGASPLEKLRKGLGKETGQKPEGGGDKPHTLRNVGVGFGEVEYQIHLLGQVKFPGTYRLSASTRLDEAISKAGGVNESGSRRKIEVRREGKTLAYDIFKFQRFGDLSQNPFLLDNDVVYIPFSQSNVSIKGPVKSSGVYELTTDSNNLSALVNLAGGYTSGVSEIDPVVVVRFIGKERTITNVANVRHEMQNFELIDGDIVIVPHVLVEGRRFDYNLTELPADNVYYPTEKSTVFVTGAVASGGSFPFNVSYNLRDYISLAGLTPISNIRSAYVLTANGKYIRNPQKRNFKLSPGDTIVVPNRHMTTDNFLKWYGTVTGTIFTSFALKELIK